MRTIAERKRDRLSVADRIAIAWFCGDDPSAPFYLPNSQSWKQFAFPCDLLPTDVIEGHYVGFAVNEYGSESHSAIVRYETTSLQRCDDCHRYASPRFIRERRSTMRVGRQIEYVSATLCKRCAQRFYRELSLVRQCDRLITQINRAIKCQTIDSATQTICASA